MFVPDAVLVTVGFYLGENKENIGGAIPIIIICSVTLAAMVASEVVAQLQNSQGQPQTHQENTFVISNLIPFRNLNVMFAFGYLIRLVLWCFQKELLGVPMLSIQGNAMLICLLVNNDEAKKRFKKRLRKWRGNNVELEQRGNDVELEQRGNNEETENIANSGLPEDSNNPTDADCTVCSLPLVEVS